MLQWRNTFISDLEVARIDVRQRHEKVGSFGVLHRGARLWHLPCARRISQPRSLLNLKITSPHYVFDNTVRKEVLLELLSACLQEKSLSKRSCRVDLHIF